MPKQGDVIQNYQGRYAKVVTVKNNHYGLSAFVGKKDDAEKETVAVKFLNKFGMSQIAPDKGAKTEAPKEDKVTTTTKATKKTDESS